MTETDRILDKMSLQFMQPSFTASLDWFEIDGSNGLTYVAFEDSPSIALQLAEISSPDEDARQEALIEALADHYDGTIYSVSETRGYGAQLSAPGYMDCTDWCVFDTLAEAKQYLVDVWADDDEEGE